MDFRGEDQIHEDITEYISRDERTAVLILSALDGMRCGWVSWRSYIRASGLMEPILWALREGRALDRADGPGELGFPRLAGVGAVCES